jgi:hypothetical protein
MSEQSQKSRFAVDLDDLERQLRDMQVNETRQPSADPLAELARLVGQDDPLKNVFGVGQPGQAQPSPHYEVPPEDLRGSVDEFDAIFDRHAPVPPPASAQDTGMLDDELARQVLAAIAPEARAEAGHSTAAPQAGAANGAGDPFADFGDFVSRDHARADMHANADIEYASQHDTTRQDPFHADAEIMGAVAAAAAGASMARGGAAVDAYEEAEPAAGQPPRTLGKGAVTAIALLAVGVVGIGGAAIWRGGKTSDGEPRVIKAEPGPSRVQPQNPGGTEVPDQNKQIYERGGAPRPADTKVVNRDEQPVDVQAAIRNQPRVVLPGPGGVAPAETTQPAAGAASPVAGLGEPRKVRTVAIRPDGTVISAPPAGSTPAASGATPQLTSPQALTPQSAPTVVSAQPAPSPQPAAATSGILRQQAPRTVVPVAAAPAAPAAPVAAAPVAETPRAVTPAPQQPRPQPQQPPRVAAAPATDAPAAGGGGFAVQLAAPGSESEARSVFSSLQRRFPDELGGQRPQIRKAEVNGREVYRLRVGPMSRESAADLCTRLKGRGGQCFLAGN